MQNLKDIRVLDNYEVNHSEKITGMNPYQSPTAEEKIFGTRSNSPSNEEKIWGVSPSGGSSFDVSKFVGTGKSSSNGNFSVDKFFSFDNKSKKGNDAQNKVNMMLSGNNSSSKVNSMLSGMGVSSSKKGNDAQNKVNMMLGGMGGNNNPAQQKINNMLGGSSPKIGIGTINFSAQNKMNQFLGGMGSNNGYAQQKMNYMLGGMGSNNGYAQQKMNYMLGGFGTNNGYAQQKMNYMLGGMGERSIGYSSGFNTQQKINNILNTNTGNGYAQQKINNILGGMGGNSYGYSSGFNTQQKISNILNTNTGNGYAQQKINNILGMGPMERKMSVMLPSMGRIHGDRFSRNEEKSQAQKDYERRLLEEQLRKKGISSDANGVDLGSIDTSLTFGEKKNELFNQLGISQGEPQNLKQAQDDFNAQNERYAREAQAKQVNDYIDATGLEVAETPINYQENPSIDINNINYDKQQREKLKWGNRKLPTYGIDANKPVDTGFIPKEKNYGQGFFGPNPNVIPSYSAANSEYSPQERAFLNAVGNTWSGAKQGLKSVGKALEHPTQDIYGVFSSNMESVGKSARDIPGSLKQGFERWTGDDMRKQREAERKLANQTQIEIRDSLMGKMGRGEEMANSYLVNIERNAANQAMAIKPKYDKEVETKLDRINFLKTLPESEKGKYIEKYGESGLTLNSEDKYNIEKANKEAVTKQKEVYNTLKILKPQDVKAVAEMRKAGQLTVQETAFLKDYRKEALAPKPLPRAEDLTGFGGILARGKQSLGTSFLQNAKDSANMVSYQTGANRVAPQDTVEYLMGGQRDYILKKGKDGKVTRTYNPQGMFERRVFGAMPQNDSTGMMQMIPTRDNSAMIAAGSQIPFTSGGGFNVMSNPRNTGMYSGEGAAQMLGPQSSGPGFAGMVGGTMGGSGAGFGVMMGQSSQTSIEPKIGGMGAYAFDDVVKSLKMQSSGPPIQQQPMQQVPIQQQPMYQQPMTLPSHPTNVMGNQSQPSFNVISKKTASGYQPVALQADGLRYSALSRRLVRYPRGPYNKSENKQQTQNQQQVEYSAYAGV